MMICDFSLFLQQELLSCHSEDTPSVSGDRCPEGTGDGSGTDQYPATQCCLLISLIGSLFSLQ